MTDIHRANHHQLDEMGISPMSMAALNTSTSADTIVDGDLEYTLDEHGMPVMPEWLQEYADMILTKNGAETKRLAQEVYALWKQNDFTNVRTVLERTTAKPRCQSNLANARNFDDDEPYLEDYLEDYGDPSDPEGAASAEAQRQFEYDSRLHEIRKAMAKSYCTACPLKMQCLARSITQNRRDRSGDINHNSVGLLENGIHGGYGPGARKYVQNQMVKIWNRPENEWDYNSKHLQELAAAGEPVPSELLQQ